MHRAGLSFIEKSKSFLSPTDEAYTAAILSRLYKYGGMPLKAHLSVLVLMRQTHVTNRNLTLFNYLPCLAKAMQSNPDYADLERRISLYS